MHIDNGSAAPLGANWDGKGVNFALFSKHAEKVELCLFDSSGQREIARHRLPGKTGDLWHGYIAGLPPGSLYGYRVYGPYEPELGHRFNPHKLLIDPYAKQLNQPLRRHRSQLGYIPDSELGDLSFCTMDSAPHMPKCVVIEPPQEYPKSAKPDNSWSDTVIYETHLRGFSIANPDIPADWRGKFLGLAQPAAIRYLKQLGISSLELLPIHAFCNESFLEQRGLDNYWGYNTLAYFAPEPRYAKQQALVEFRQMVAALHAADIEVILDVVYNHSAEGDELGPHLSFRGIDNASYYRLQENPRFYINDTGCGNTLNADCPQVRDMILDSMRYWAVSMGVDGFRFDLAPALARENGTYNPNSEFFQAAAADPELRRCKLIAEPWDIGPGGYQLGNFPQQWAEWNDRFRDDIRCFWRGDEDKTPNLARRLHGSSELFQHNHRQPNKSINFITAHDGFTLYDVVSYNDKHNDQNQEGNRDGHNGNHSSNYGEEGPSSDPQILATRRRQHRNMLATTILAQGTPMLLAGDEFCNSQNGNNNAYCQDNEISWLNWQHSAEQKRMVSFTRLLVQLRKRHPLLRLNQYLHSEECPSGSQIQWLDSHGGPMPIERWHDHQNRVLGCLISQTSVSAQEQQADAQRILLLFNASTEDYPFQLPASEQPWSIELDTQYEDGLPISQLTNYSSITLKHRSVIVLSQV